MAPGAAIGKSPRTANLDEAVCRPVVESLIAEIERSPSKLAVAARWCGMPITSWDSGIMLAPRSDTPLGHSVRKFAESAIPSETKVVSGVSVRASVEMERLPASLATSIQLVTPRGMIPLLEVKVTEGTGWGNLVQRWSSVSLHFRPAR